jgi:UDP-GlcNAc:undecaprenyl-phosphate GlcNAc-1-phosphate transferase
MYERLRQGRPVFKADKNHIHHKLLRLGLRHNESVMVIYALQLGMILIAWTGRYADNAVLFVSFLILGGLSIYFLTLGSRIQWVVKFPNNMSKPNSVKKGGIGATILSREMTAKVTWYGLLYLLSLFYFVSPFLIESVSISVGFFSIGMIVCLLLLKRFSMPYITFFLTISFYFLGLYYIFFTEYSQNTFYITFQYRPHYNIFFTILGICYLGHLISTSERVSFTTNDFLMLTVVIFLFFLPKDYTWTVHARSIAVKAFLIFICMELIFKRLKTKINSTLTPALLLLGVNCFVAFLPLIM